MALAAVVDMMPESKTGQSKTGQSETSQWTESPPGLRLACALADVRLAELSDEELVEVMAASRRQTSWAQEREMSAVAELSRRRHQSENGPAAAGYGHVGIHEIVTEEVSLALTLTATAASVLVVRSEQLAEQLPLTRVALRTGRIDMRRAEVIIDAVRGLDDALAGAVEAAIIAEAHALTTGKLRRRVTEAIRAADPEAARERKKAAVKDRRMELFPNSSGTADLALRDLPPEPAERIWNKLTAVAKAMKADGDQRPLDALRADLATALLNGRPLPDAARDLIRDLEDFEDLDPAPGEHGARPDRGTAEPGAEERTADQADSVGPMDRQIAEALARGIDQRLAGVLAQARRDGRLNGLALLIAHAMQAMQDGLADLKDHWCQTTGGAPGKHGHNGYRPPAAMRRLIERRHRTCAFPTCNRQAERCDLDHTIPWHKGARTCRCNLSPLCRKHHRLKQHPAWKLFQPWPGLLIWITPSGTWHMVSPQ